MPPKLGFSGHFTPKMRSNVNATPKRHICGRNGSSGVLIMSLSVIVPEKLRGNKKCDKEEEKEEEEEEGHFLGLFGIGVKWPRHGCMQCNFFDIYMFILSRTAR